MEKIRVKSGGLRAKRLAAAAGLVGVGVCKLKAAANEGIAVVEHETV